MRNFLVGILVFFVDKFFEGFLFFLVRRKKIINVINGYLYFGVCFLRLFIVWIYFEKNSKEIIVMFYFFVRCFDNNFEDIYF